MKKAVKFFLVTSCLVGSISFAQADEALILKSNCLACHSVDKRKYGPTFNEVAAKYANDDKSAKKLAKKIKAGGTGVWGVDVMPAQPKLSQADSLTLAKYVLSLK